MGVCFSHGSVVYEVDTHYCVRDSSVTLWVTAMVDDNSEMYDPNTYPALLRDWFRKTAEPAFEKEVPDEDETLLEENIEQQSINHEIPGEVNPLAAGVEIKIPHVDPPENILDFGWLLQPVILVPLVAVVVGCIAVGVRYYRRRLEYQRVRSPRVSKTVDLASSVNFNHYGTFGEGDPDPDEGTCLLDTPIAPGQGPPKNRFGMTG